MRLTARRLLAALMVMFGAALLLVGPAGPAQAKAPNTSNCNYPASKCACPSLSVSTTAPDPGERIRVTGTNFEPRTKINLVLKPVVPKSNTQSATAARATGEFTVGSVVSDTNGSFSTSVLMPKQADGTYDLYAVGGTPETARTTLGCPADPSQRLQIGGDNSNRHHSNGNPTGTAFTGFNLLWLLLLAAVLIAIGVYMARRGRKGETVRSIHG